MQEAGEMDVEVRSGIDSCKALLDSLGRFAGSLGAEASTPAMILTESH